MGGVLAECGKDIFRPLTRHPEVEGIRAEVDSVTPAEFARRADLDLLEGTAVTPQSEDPFSG